MNRFHPAVAALLVALLSVFAGVTIAADDKNTWDGLTKVKSKRLDDVFLLPGADFSGYKSVLLLPVEVAMQKNWQRDMNRDKVSSTHNITPEDVTKIRAEVAQAVADIFKEELQKGGYTVVTQPGPETLSLQPVILNLYINAPEGVQPTAGRSKTYTFEAGYATLALEARDAGTNQLMGRAVDSREARSNGTMQWTTSVSNRADFKNLFRTWAKILVKGLDDLRERPVPLPKSGEGKAAA